MVVDSRWNELPAFLVCKCILRSTQFQYFDLRATPGLPEVRPSSHTTTVQLLQYKENFTFLLWKVELQTQTVIQSSSQQWSLEAIAKASSLQVKELCFQWGKELIQKECKKWVEVEKSTYTRQNPFFLLEKWAADISYTNVTQHTN